jgi:hypothetical protein
MPRYMKVRAAMGCLIASVLFMWEQVSALLSHFGF